MMLIEYPTWEFSCFVLCERKKEYIGTPGGNVGLVVLSVKLWASNDVGCGVGCAVDWSRCIPVGKTGGRLVGQWNGTDR